MSKQEYEAPVVACSVTHSEMWGQQAYIVELEGGYIEDNRITVRFVTDHPVLPDTLYRVTIEEIKEEEV